MAELAVGTAGHVDHGKTQLVRALTGVDGDRLPTERERGMTIVLGFAPWRLPSGREVSVVDVPGHERFVRTMATGVRSIDCAVVCVAVDDGVMPQTLEHLAVLRLLGIGTVVVAVTKVDLAGDRVAGDRVGAVGRAARGRAEQLGLAVAGVVGVSARSGQGLHRLAAAVDGALEGIAAPADRGIPRLFVDRSFTRAGIGTVVTGTLDGGGVRLGDPVQAWPAGARGRIVQLERRGRSASEAEPGGRLGMAVRGLARPAVPRGSILVPPGALEPTAAVDVLIEVPEAGATGVRHGARVECLHGTQGVAASVWLAGEAAVAPGHSAYGQLRLAHPVAALAGDRVLLRAPAPAATLAGGLILDTRPGRHRRWTAAPLDGWAARARALAGPAGPSRLAPIEVSASPCGLEAQVAARRAGVTLGAAREALDTAVAAGELVAVGARYLARDRWGKLEARARALVAASAEEDPLAPGLPRRVLLQRLGFGGDEAEPLLLRLQAVGALELRGAVAVEPGTRHRPQPEDPAVARAQRLFESAGVEAPGTDALRAAGVTARLLGYLHRSGAVVEVAPGVHLAAAAHRAVLDQVVAALRASPAGLTVSELRSQAGTSRRVMVPLLEQLGREGRTRREGERHQLVDGARPAAVGSAAPPRP